MTRLVLIRHARPLVTDGASADQWALTERGRGDAVVFGRRLGHRFTTEVYTSPERKARETAALAFPSAAAQVREQLSEVKRPWYAKPDEFADAVANYLRGDVVERWERRDEVIARLAWLKADPAPSERIVVGRGVLLTTWLHHQVKLEDPFWFWSNLRLPDAWELDPEEKSLERVA